MIDPALTIDLRELASKVDGDPQLVCFWPGHCQGHKLGDCLSTMRETSPQQTPQDEVVTSSCHG